jgi:hypothetical protein
LTGEVSHTRAESAAPGQALRSRDSMCGRAVPRGVPPACRAIARDPTCTACRGNGLGVRLRRRRTQAHDEMPPRRAVREGPTFAHGAQPGGHGASPPHRTWPSRSPCRRSSDLHPARSSTGIRCTDSAVTIVIEWIEPGLTTVARGVAASTRMRRDSACRPRSPACLSHAQKRGLPGSAPDLGRPPVRVHDQPERSMADGDSFFGTRRLCLQRDSDGCNGGPSRTELRGCRYRRLGSSTARRRRAGGWDMRALWPHRC